MSPGSTDPVPLVTRARFLLRRFVLIVLSRIRRALGIAAQSLQRDEIGELRYETRALGSASVESVAHVGAELREINERLSRLEREVARLAEQRVAEGRSTDERREPTPQSLSAD